MLFTVVDALFVLISLLALPSSNGSTFCNQPHCQDKVTVQQIAFIDGARGSDLSDCSQDTSPCRTLEYALTKRDSKSVVFNMSLLSSNVQLMSVLEVYNHNTFAEISISGQPNMTYIQCSNLSNSGIYFRGLNAVTIRNVVLEDCGWINFNLTTGCNQSGYMMAIGLVETANIIITNMTIRNSRGLGLALLNASGHILILHSKFTGNVAINNYTAGGGGILIQAHFQSCNFSQTRYNIQNCSFVQNTVSDGCDGGYDQGGGVKIFFEGSSCANHVTVTDCVFNSNQATWGGGLYLHFTGNVSENFVHVKRCTLQNNRANMSGGGSNSGYFSDTSIPPPINKNNIVHFESVKFANNIADYGGGSSIFSSHGENFSNENQSITFTHCQWTNNMAYFSSAVDISPYVWDTLKGGYLPAPVFRNCSFVENTNIDRIAQGTGYQNIGSFTATSFTVHFFESVTFLSNSRSAICLMSSIAIFHDRMYATFVHNSGIEGGAVSLYGTSMMIVSNNSVFKFVNNTAAFGGAISYFSNDQHDYVSSRSCFIQFQDNASTIAPLGYMRPDNVTFTFQGNNASISGNAVYATSLWPCYFACKYSMKIQNLSESFNCVGDFNISSTDISTWPEYFRDLNESQLIYVIPGLPRSIHVSLYDETNATVSYTIFSLNLRNNPEISVCNRSQYTNAPTVCVEGQLSTPANVTLQTVGDRILETNLTIATLTCPPGYVFNSNGDCGTARICACSALCKGHTYPGIEVCDSTSFQAFVDPSTWVGYLNGGAPDESNLYTAPCVSHLCIRALQNRTGAGFPLGVALPSGANLSGSDLPQATWNALIEEAVCAENRQGVLCANCTSNNSAYYHSLDYTCGRNVRCRYGGLFYVVSEILPLTVLFSAAMVFDVRFTSGDVNGFVLFCQIFSSFDLTAGGMVNMPRGASLLNDLARIMYGFFNLDFFSHPNLEFCIWEGATILDVLSFKYVTTVYAFGLIMSLILAMNYCSCIARVRGIYRIKNMSFIHGLTAFLIVSYSQCAQVTCAILLPVDLFGKNGVRGPCMSKYGGVLYFNEEHLPYAVPACIAAVILLLPPFILILNPLYNKVLGCLPCSESPFFRSTTLLCSKPKPFLDSFQGCFKDDLRFFAGLYFVYRLLPASVYMFVTTPLQGLILIESFLVSFLLTHAVFQPYTDRAHNVLDGLLFAILVAINSFTLFNFSNVSNPAEQTSVIVLCWSQVLLSYIPLCYIIWYISRSIMKKCSNRISYVHVCDEEEDMSIINSDRLIS